jgi:hypothetical protein
MSLAGNRKDDQKISIEGTGRWLQVGLGRMREVKLFQLFPEECNKAM